MLLVRAKYHSVWEPLGLMYLASFIEDIVDEVKIMDASFEDESSILREALNYDFIGLSGQTPQLKNILNMAEKIREQGDSTKIILGGYGPGMEAEKVSAEKFIDHIVVGEGEEALRKIITGETDKRIIYGEPIADLDSVPLPNRRLVDLNRYISIADEEEGRRVTSIVSVRGCAFKCRFCNEGYSGISRMRLRNPRLVVDEMEQVKREYDIEFFKFSDSETNATKNHILSLCRELQSRQWDTPWGVNVRADKVDDEICLEAYKAGCREFWVGVESGSNLILRELNKAVTVEMIKRTFSVARKHGILRKAYVMLGSPSETHETICETEKLLDEIDPDSVSITILCPYPGTFFHHGFIAEYPDVDWSTFDNYSNKYWHSNTLSNKDLRSEQARLMDKYSVKLAPIVLKKRKIGVIGGNN